MPENADVLLICTPGTPAVADELRDAGLTVAVVATDEADPDTIAASPPGCILLRIDGPDTCLSLCRRIKAQPMLGGVPVLLVAGPCGGERCAEAIELGVADCMAEPLHTDLVAARIRTHLALTRADTAISHQSQALREGESLIRSLFDSMLNCAVYCRILYRGGMPYDFVYLAVNMAYIAHTGFTDAVGRRASELLPGLHGPDRELLDRYGRVASTGEPDRFEIHLSEPDEWYAVSAYSPQPDHFVAVFDVITARKHAEAELRAREERHGAILEAAMDGLWVVDGTGRITQTNEAYCRMSGYSASELIGKPVWEIDAFESPADTAERLRRLSAEGSVRFDTRHRRKDGSLFDVEVSGRFGGGPSAPFIAFIRDITDQKRARAELLESEERHRSIIQTAISGFWRVDLQGRILEANGAFCRLTGYDLEELLTMRISDVDADHDSGAIATHIGMITEVGHYRFETRHRRRDGAIRDVEISAQHPKGSDYIVGFARDITERKEAERTLRDTEERHRLILDAAIDGLFALDLRGRVVFANDAYCRMSGYTVDELTGMHIGQIDASEKPEETAARIRQVAEQGTGRFEVKHRRKDGTAYDVEVSARFSGGPNGYFVSFLRDVTDRNRAEAELRESESRYRALFDQVPVGLWEEDFSAVSRRFDELRAAGVTDMRAYLEAHPQEVEEMAARVQVLEVNFRGATLLGAADQTHLLRDLYRFFTPESAGVFREELIALAQGALAFQSEVPVVNAAGEPIVLELALSVPADRARDLSRVLVSFVDATERKRAERTLRETQRRFLSAFEHAPNGVALVAPDGRWLKVNRAICDLLGYSEEELLSGNFQMLTHPDDLEADLQQVRRVLADEIRTYQMEKRYYRKDGSLLWALLSVSLVRDDEGVPLHFISNVEDISERRRAERAIAIDLAQERLHSEVLRMETEQDWTDVVEIFSRSARSLLGFHACAVNVLDWGANLVRCHRWRDDMGVETLIKHGIPPAIRRAVETGAPLVRGTRQDPYFGPEMPDDVHSVVDVPFAGGTVAVNSRSENAFGDEEVAIIARFAQILSVAHQRLSDIQALSRRAFELEAENAERRRAEAALQLANRALRTVRECDMALVRATDEESLLQDICQILVQHGGYRMAWVGYAVHDAAKSIVPISQAGIGERYLKSLALTWADEARGRGPTGTAIRTGQPRRINDIGTDPDFAPWRRQALRRGYASSLAVPLRGRDHVYGALNLYSSRADAFDATETALLVQLADDLAHGITSLRNDVARRQAEEALRESEERMRALIENDLSAVALFEVLTDSAGAPRDLRIVQANPAFERHTGIPVENAVGHCISELVGASDPDSAVAILGAVGLTGEPRVFEICFDPLQRHYHVSAYRAGAGRCAAVFEDVTERRQAEAHKARLEAELQHAMKMESVGRLAGGVAHDFNNMLGVILGHTELAMVRPGTPLSVLADLEEVRKAAERSANLTRQLLAFARKQTITPKVIDLNEAVAGMLKMLKRVIGEDVDLSWRPGAGLKPVLVDPSQIDQILANLCVNARDAIAGVGRMTIRTGSALIAEDEAAAHPGCPAGEYVWLAVADNGSGMDEETRTHLFEPFFTTKELGKGTGLGLATVHGAVEQNLGFITVQSEPGDGATFTVYLPAHPGPLPEAGDPERDSPPTDTRSAHEKLTILVVEDEPTILDLTCAMLTEQGYDVITADSAGQALQIANRRGDEIRLLLTDVVMPEMNGRDLARAIETINPRVRVLFMSGYTAGVIARHGIIDQSVHFIQKPFNNAELTVAVRHALNDPD